MVLMLGTRHFKVSTAIRFVNKLKNYNYEIALQQVCQYC